ncbi:MAG: LPXTG cell wall anchor domain-containing protein [Nanoarchaeota archaeon]|nr:LPXTG cell wall anchor domain-containing protein [Nanoarchaeota archaeon]
MENKKTTKLVFASVIALALLLSFVSASGVTSFYWDGDNEMPLYLQPGESKEIFFELQNMVGTDDLNFKVSITKGAEFIELIDSNEVYNVPAQTQNIKVNVKVTMPATAKMGERHNVILSFSAANPSASGFSLGSVFDKSFDIVVPTEKTVIEDKHVKSNNSYIYMLVGIIILIAIIVWFVRKSKNK